MGKIVVTGHLQVPESELDTVLEGLQLHIELSRQESGNLVFEITQDESDQHKLNIYEEYNSPEAFEFHKERAKSSAWAAISQNVERHLEISELDA